MNRSATFAMTSLVLAFCLAAPSAGATSAGDGTTHKQKKPSAARSTRIKTAPQHDNGESAADRDRRFRRECRGLPNAGACQGYGYGS